MYRASWMSVDEYIVDEYIVGEYIHQGKIVTHIFKEVANARQAS